MIVINYMIYTLMLGTHVSLTNQNSVFSDMSQALKTIAQSS